jgi:hypothetical protein
LPGKSHQNPKDGGLIRQSAFEIFIRGYDMKNPLWTGVLTLLVSSSFAVAQNSAPQSPSSTTPSASQPAANPAGEPLKIAPGSVIPVQLTKSVDAKKAKVGDEIDAKVTQDMKSTNGQILVAKDTKVVGHITEAQAHSKEQKESQLAIAFDHAVMKNGADVKLPMSIQAIIAPPSVNSNNGGGASAPTPEAAPSGGSSLPSAGRAGVGGTSGGAPQPQISQPSSSSEVPSGNNGNGGTNASRPEITANTQGVVGFANLKLSAANDASQGSVVSSEKNNVKLESGTLMLLRVAQ